MTYKFQRSFSSAHFYKQAQWSVEKNQQEFGKCFTEYGHGHDYALEIEIRGDNPIALSVCVQRVLDQLDHQHLNFVIPEFKTQIPTTENISLFLQTEIQKEFQKSQLKAEILSLKLSENSEIWVEL